MWEGHLNKYTITVVYVILCGYIILILSHCIIHVKAIYMLTSDLIFKYKVCLFQDRTYFNPIQPIALQHILANEIALRMIELRFKKIIINTVQDIHDIPSSTLRLPCQPINDKSLH